MELKQYQTLAGLIVKRFNHAQMLLKEADELLNLMIGCTQREPEGGTLVDVDQLKKIDVKLAETIGEVQKATSFLYTIRE